MTSSALLKPSAQDSCEHPEVVRRAGPGRERAYQQFGRLPLPDDLNVPTCTTCGEVFAQSDTDAAAIDGALEAAWRARVNAQAKEWLQGLVDGGMRKRDLEALLGLSPGYLSKVAGSKDPSPLLAATLALLSASPQSRVQELREAWNPGTVRRASATVQALPDIPIPSNVLPFPKGAGSSMWNQQGTDS